MHMRIFNLPDPHVTLESVIDHAVQDADVMVIARCNAPNAVVMSFDYYSSLMETMYLLGTPANAAHLAKSLAQARKGT